jgi:hypothetical protein
MLFTAIDRQGVVFLWPIRTPDADGRHNSWHASALQGAEMAMKDWVRVTPNRSLGAYDLEVVQAEVPEPEWPDLTFRNLLEIAFKDTSIRSLDHPVIQRLRGLR